jgi:beta-xylosidase
MPILAPITWGSDGFPILTTVNGSWGTSYPDPLPASSTPSWLGTDTFPGTALDVHWEWNHNPDSTKYSVNNGLTLSTATVTTDLTHARNTLTHRIHGPLPVGTVHIDFTNMADGDHTGLAAFRDNSSYIGISRSDTTYTLEFVTGISQNSSANWATISNGTVSATKDLSGTKEVWLRTSIDAQASGTHLAEFYYSLDGTAFTQLGGSAELVTGWQYFMGYRFAIFNYATKALGGSVLVKSFTSA